MSAKVSEFTVDVCVRVPRNEIQKLNEYHTGQKTFPFDKPIPKSKTGYNIEDVHHRAFMNHISKVKIELFEDGTTRVKEWQL